MLGYEQRRTHQEWADHLGAPERKLTLAEFTALELSLLHALVADIHAALGMNPNRIGGNLDQVQRLLGRLVHVALRSKRALGEPATPDNPAMPAPRREDRTGGG